MNLPQVFQQTETLLFLIQLAFLLAVAVLEALRKAHGAATILSVAALLSAAASGLARTLAAGHLPFASTYEFGLLLCLILDASLVTLCVRKPKGSFSLAASLVALALGSATLLLFQTSRPLAPALKSWWLGAHVLTAVFAYACLALAAALGALGLRRGKSDAELADIERLAKRLISIAFPFLTLLIVTGAIWAENAWGSFWSWDPKETWALITWLVYLGLLHLVRSRGLKGRKFLALALGCFAVVLFTFFGVSYLLAGLHASYR